MKNKIVLTFMVLSLSAMLFGCGTNAESETNINNTAFTADDSVLYKYDNPSDSYTIKSVSKSESLWSDNITHLELPDMEAVDFSWSGPSDFGGNATCVSNGYYKYGYLSITSSNNTMEMNAISNVLAAGEISKAMEEDYLISLMLKVVSDGKWNYEHQQLLPLSLSGDVTTETDGSKIKQYATIIERKLLEDGTEEVYGGFVCAVADDSTGELVMICYRTKYFNYVESEIQAMIESISLCDTIDIPGGIAEKTGDTEDESRGKYSFTKEFSHVLSIGLEANTCINGYVSYYNSDSNYADFVGTICNQSRENRADIENIVDIKLSGKISALRGFLQFDDFTLLDCNESQSDESGLMLLLKEYMETSDDIGSLCEYNADKNMLVCYVDENDKSTATMIVYVPNMNKAFCVKKTVYTYEKAGEYKIKEDASLTAVLSSLEVTKVY